MELAEFVRDVIRGGGLDLVASAAGIRESLDPDEVHRARVATRRLRSDLRGLRGLLLPDEVDALRGELEWLGALLGGVRDHQVLLARIEGDLGAGEPALAERLRGRVADQRDFRAGLLLSAMGGHRYTDLLDRLSAAADQPPFRDGVDPEGPAEPVARTMATTAWARTVRWAEHLEGEDLDGPELEAGLHELRKRVKRARYATSAVRPFTGARTRRFAKALRGLQDELGAIQDAATAQRFLERTAPRLDAASAFGAGRYWGRIARDAELRRQGWRDDWARAARRAPRWMS